MTAEKITLYHPYRPLFSGVWFLFAVLLLLGFFQGQSILIFALGTLSFVMTLYTLFAQTEIIVDLVENKELRVQKRPINLRQRTLSLDKIEIFTTSANRLRLDEDEAQLGYHLTRPVSYEIEAVLKNGRALLLAEAHTEEKARHAVAQLNALLLTDVPSSPH